MDDSQKYKRVISGWGLIHITLVGLGIVFNLTEIIRLQNILVILGSKAPPTIRILQIGVFLQMAMNAIHLYFAVSKKENSLKMMKYTFIARSIIGISLYIFASGPLRTSILYLEILIIPSLLLSYKNHAKLKRVLTNYGKESIEDYTL